MHWSVPFVVHLVDREQVDILDYPQGRFVVLVQQSDVKRRAKLQARLLQAGLRVFQENFDYLALAVLECQYQRSGEVLVDSVQELMYCGEIGGRMLL